jgi:hypothetical protein
VSFVELHIDEANKQFLIYGDIPQINANRRAKYYFLDVLHASIDSAKISIRYGEEDKELILQEIQQALTKYGIEQKDSEEIKEVLNDYYREKKNFEVFSQKARGIWNNEISVVHPKTWTEGLNKVNCRRRSANAYETEFQCRI